MPIPSALVHRIFNWRLPQDAAQHGTALDHHLLLNLWIALALLILAHIALFVGLALRRRTTTSAAHWRWEVLPLLAIALLFIALSIKAERLWASQRYAGADPAALQVEITGMQFAWYFRYPGTDARFGQTSSTLVDAGAGNALGIGPSDDAGKDDLVSSELVLPIDHEIDLRIVSQDVIHGFFVPEMRLKQNAIPGQTFHIHFTPTREGSYAILCSQVCGLGHHRMLATMRIVSQQQFAQWLATKAATQTEVKAGAR